MDTVRQKISKWVWGVDSAAATLREVPRVWRGAIMEEALFLTVGGPYAIAIIIVSILSPKFQEYTYLIIIVSVSEEWRDNRHFGNNCASDFNNIYILTLHRR